MTETASPSVVRDLMTEFASQSGLAPTDETPRRYLWTDAFAVCNFLELYRQTGDNQFKQLALRLIEQVHHVLGRHRDDDVRTGWISGLDQDEGELHPTQGGLRIGKAMPERGPTDAFDENLEWDQDGQYYHYLTKWMHALSRISRVTGNPIYNRWARELAKTAHANFTYVPSFGGQKYMYWKMSVDLSRPLVPSMGQHDPLDGFLTYHELQLTAADNSDQSMSPDLSEEINDMANICEGKSWVTNDPLGVGGLLADVYKVVQMMVIHEFGPPHLLKTLLDAALRGLEGVTRTNILEYPVEYRLAFRELGLSIGLHAVEPLRDVIQDNPDCFPQSLATDQRIEMLMRYTPLTEAIERFWLEDSQRVAKSWTEHRNINSVMLATSLAPEGFLAL